MFCVPGCAGMRCRSVVKSPSPVPRMIPPVPSAYYFSCPSYLTHSCSDCGRIRNGSIITPSILGLRSSGSCVSSRVISGCVWNWCLAGVKSVNFDFSAEMNR